MTALKLQSDDLDAKKAISEIYRKMAFEFYAKGKLATAIDNYTIAIHFSPLNADLFCFRGKSYLVLEEIEKARLDFEEGIRIDPTNVQVVGMNSLLSGGYYVSGCEPFLPKTHFKKCKDVSGAKGLRNGAPMPFEEILIDMLLVPEDKTD
jgi:tetratricopeptide (TPR) repeat protein